MSSIRQVLLLNLAVATLAAKLSHTVSFEQYVDHYRRDYRAGSDEFLRRQELFHLRQQEVAKQNSNPHRLWTAALNHFTDRTENELKQRRGWRHTGPDGRNSGASLLETHAQRRESLREAVDWRNTSSAQNVVDQGSCGSCWAVATAAMLQAHTEIHMGDSRSFSAQELVNCVPNPHECGGSGGCEGATVELAMKYVQEHGLSTLDQTPYSGVDEKCKASGSSLIEGTGTSLSGLQSWETLPSNQAEPLMAALQRGPVAISAAAANWFSYSTGVFNSCEKDAVIDHAILMVGYGKDAGANYWTVQNSWSNLWGENGFIRIKRGNTIQEDDDYCGTDSRPGDGIACKPYPDSVTVCGQCGLLYDSVSPKFANVAMLQSRRKQDGFLARSQ